MENPDGQNGQIINQNNLLESFKRRPYRECVKSSKIEFTVAQEEIVVKTIVNGVTETTNVAQTGDYIATGPFGEKWVIKPEKFHQLYDIVEDGIAASKPVSRFAYRWNWEPFYFTASWGETMLCETGDYLVSDINLSEVYRIEKKVFEKTYVFI